MGSQAWTSVSLATDLGMTRPLKEDCAPEGPSSFAASETHVPSDKYIRVLSDVVETGALVHAPSATELAGWRMRRGLLGLILMVLTGLAIYLAIMGLLDDPEAGGGVVLTTIITLGAGCAIGFFGIRYFLLGLKGQGFKLYERAVEAEFFETTGLAPRRRTVPLLRVHISGSGRLPTGQAITTTGHAFRLPSGVMDEADLWYLGSLGTRPLAPGGREAKEAYSKGELGPYQREPPAELVDHGKPWPPIPGAGDDVVVMAETTPEDGSREETPPRPAPAVPAAPTMAPAAPAPRTFTRPQRVPVPEVPVAPQPPEEPMRVLEDLPETPRDIPAPPTVAPFTPPRTVPSPPGPAIPPPEVPAPVSDEWELEELPPPDVPSVPPVTPAPAPSTPSDGADEWELEELPPPGEEEKKPPSAPSGWDWEEL